MIDPKTLVERELDTIRRELRELTYSVNRVLRIFETFVASRPLSTLAGTLPIDPQRTLEGPTTLPIDPHGRFAKAQAETQGRVLEEPVVPPDSAWQPADGKDAPVDSAPEKPKQGRVRVQVGQRYLRRDGRVVGPAEKDSRYAVGGWMYTEDGRFYGADTEHPYDLIDYA